MKCNMAGLAHDRSMASLMREAEGGWEDVEAGTIPHDEDHPVVVVEPEPPEPVPVTPMTNMQPTELDTLPIDEEDYVPTGADELGRATRLLFKELPDEVASWMWNKVKKLKDKVDEQMEDQGYVDADTEQGYMNIESRLHRIVGRALNEAGQKKDPWARETEGGVYPDEPSAKELAAIEKGEPETWGGVEEPMAVMALSSADADLLKSIQSQADPDEIDPADRIADEEEAEKDPKRRKKYVTAGEEGASLKDIAKEMGYSGASGVKNLLYKIEDKMQYFAALDEVWFKKLMEAFAVAYVVELKDAVGENLDQEEVAFLDELMSDTDTVMRLPEFRVWAQEYLTQIYKKKKGRPSKY